jgi:anti-anti-sigma factor
MDDVGPADDPPMEFDLGSEADGTAVVTVRGDLDIASTDRLHEAVAPVIRQRPPRLVVDVESLRFADSSAIALWVRWAAAVDNLELRGASPLLRRLITSMGLEHHLRLAA